MHTVILALTTALHLLETPSFVLLSTETEDYELSPITMCCLWQ